MKRWLAIILCMALWVALFWVVGARADAPDLSGTADPGRNIVPQSDRAPPLPPIRTLTVMGGNVISYHLVSETGGRVLQLLMSVDHYDAVGRLHEACRMDCVLRVYIAQEGR